MNYKARSIEQIPKISKAKFIRSTILPLAFFFMLNLILLVLFQIKNPNRGYEVIKNKWTIAKEYKGSIDWLIIGDSACNQGFNNEVFDQIIGGHSLNLCTIGDMLLSDDVWLLEQLIEREVIPENLIFSHTYDVWQRSEIPELSFQQIPKLNFESSINLPFNKNYLVQYFPIIYQVKTIIQLIRDPRKLLNANQEYSSQGQQIIKEHFPSKVIKDSQHHIDLANKEIAFNVSEENLKAFEKLVTIAKRHNIKLFYTHAPIWSQVLNDIRFNKKYTKYLDFIKTLCSQNNIHLLTEEADQFELQELEGSIDHIIFTASKVYTKSIANKINDFEK